jgi:integrase/recombinase XerD
MVAPVITIFVRHAADCKYRDDEFTKRCNCRKHFRWTQNGKQYRRKAGTRSWAEAEELKRQLEDELAGRAPAETKDAQMPVSTAVEKFMQAKQNDGLEEPSLQKLQKTCDRIRDFAEKDGLFVLDSITLVHITN